MLLYSKKEPGPSNINIFQPRARKTLRQSLSFTFAGLPPVARYPKPLAKIGLNLHTSKRFRKILALFIKI